MDNFAKVCNCLLTCIIILYRLLVTCTSVLSSVMLLILLCCFIMTFAPAYEKDNNLGFRPGMTQTGLYSQRK